MCCWQLFPWNVVLGRVPERSLMHRMCIIFLCCISVWNKWCLEVRNIFASYKRCMWTRCRWLVMINVPSIQQGFRWLYSWIECHLKLEKYPCARRKINHYCTPPTPFPQVIPNRYTSDFAPPRFPKHQLLLFTLQSLFCYHNPYEVAIYHTYFWRPVLPKSVTMRLPFGVPSDEGQSYLDCGSNITGVLTKEICDIAPVGP